MTLWKKLFGNNTSVIVDPEKELADKTRVGNFYVGSFIQLSSLDWRVDKTRKLSFNDVGESHKIVAHGRIDLGDIIIHRYYSDKAFFQIVVENGEIIETKIFAEHDEVYMADQQDIDIWMKEDGIIGQPFFTLKDDTEYQRVWFEDSNRWIEARFFEEYVTLITGQEAIVEHEAMLFGRWLNEDAELSEWLLISLETRDKHSHIELSLGYDLDVTDFTVT